MDCLSENYQLKWHSFGAYLHSSVASSLTNNNDSSSFTDVVLLTIDGHQLLAHRFILSACSQYLNEILKTHCKMTTTLPLLIVLPPEINYKTLKILIQYMYSGEATVSKDILENVLRGGDLLKVKGLWRPREDEYQNERNLVKLQHGKRKHAAQEQCEKRTKAHDKQQRAERPFSVLKSTKITENSKTSTSAVLESTDCNNRSIEEGTCLKISESEERDCASNGTTTAAVETGAISSSSASMSSGVSSHVYARDHANVAEQFLVIKEEPLDWEEQDEDMDGCGGDNDVFDGEITVKAEVLIEDKQEKDESENGDQNEEIYSPLTCELCSETFTLPAEWVRHIQTHTDMMPAKRQRRGGRSSTDDDGVSGGNFPPLHCDMCQKYYPTPAEWVHHIQNTHTEFELRLSNKNNNTPNVRVPPPLIKSNNKTQQVGHTPKICTICNKKFPSHASMLIHKRTHTGEKPYTCDFCCKGFNVKSNLLRHLRTLHDRIINSAEVESKEDNGDV